MHHDIVMVTTPEEANANPQIKIYPMADLLLPAADGDERLRSLLFDRLRREVAKETWAEAGGYASILSIDDPPAMVVVQTTAKHRELAVWLERYREQKQKN